MSKNPFEMSRSHGQVSRAYAPGSLFTFEGGTVACIAFPDAENASAVEALTEVNRRQIAAIIQEYVRSWAFRAQQANNPRHDIPIELCVATPVLT